ncbi:hypothetical protein ABZ656_22280 [Streptomyces sp. NPDC007095]|uniref:hypothetical protein n=1 Tax=Streptomyces sp. NPDC007095 TaxID=3154482 RepID=UPI0033D2600E
MCSDAEARAPMEAASGVMVHPGQDRDLAVEHWLCCASQAPKEARQAWRDEGTPLLRCGILFTAVSLPGYLIHSVAGSTEPAEVDAFLAQALEGGPVIASGGLMRYWALVPPSAVDGWTDPASECLAPGTFLGVPPIHRKRHQPGLSYWSVAINSPAILCSAGLVSRLSRMGQTRHRAQLDCEGA